MGGAEGLLSRVKAVNWTRAKQIAILSAVFVVYLLIGAAVFHAVESSNEKDNRRELVGLVERFAQEHAINKTQLNGFIESYKRLSSLGAASAVENWAFAPSLFFSLTVVTTIGYGNITPLTSGGQAFSVIFALFGIPLTGLLLLKVGGVIKDVVNCRCKAILARFRSKLVNEMTVSLVLASVGIFFFLIIPAAVFHRVESWTFGQSIYYCFITLSTIGFGDYVPGQTTEHLRGLYKILVMVWIVVGLAFLAWLLEVVGDLMKTSAEAIKNEAHDVIHSLKNESESDGL